MNRPVGVTLNPIDGCLYVCDYKNSSIRKIDKSGQVTKFVDIFNPLCIVFYPKELCFFVSEVDTHSIKKVTVKGEVSTFAGSGREGYQDGAGKNAMFNYPWGITVNEETGDVYVADKQFIRKITFKGVVSTLASIADSKVTLMGICFHSNLQALFVCDLWTLKKVSLDGQISTIELNTPSHVSVLSSNSILVSSTASIYKISFCGSKTKSEVFAGSGISGYKNGLPQESKFRCLRGIATDATNNTCFVADVDRIRVIKYY